MLLGINLVFFGLFLTGRVTVALLLKEMKMTKAFVCQRAHTKNRKYSLTVIYDRYKMKNIRHHRSMNNSRYVS